MWVLLAALPLMACGGHGGSADTGGSSAPASGSGTARSYAVSGFDEVELRGADNADIRVGSAFSVRAQGPSDLLDDLEIKRDGDTLKIGRRSHGGVSWGGRTVKVFVTMPTLNEASIAGSGDMTIDRVRSADFEASTSGSGDLAIQHIVADSVDLSIAGSGNIVASGTAKQVAMSVRGSGDIDAGGLTAQQAKVSIAGSGGVKAQVNGPAKVSIMGAGDVDLGPNATCDVTKMGSGNVTCGH